MNKNFDGTTAGTEPWSVSGPMLQKLFDSPINGPGHDWVDYIDGYNNVFVHPSHTRLDRLLSRTVSIKGYIRLVKKYPRTLRFNGAIQTQMGLDDQVENQHLGLTPNQCIARGEYDFVEDARGFFRIWDDGENVPFCINSDGSKTVYTDSSGDTFTSSVFGQYLDLMTRPL